MKNGRARMSTRAAGRVVANLVRYSQITARIAPNWMKISKTSRFSFDMNARALPASIRCPVEDTGKNSVMPSTMPIARVLRTISICIGKRLRRPGGRKAAATADPTDPMTCHAGS